MKEAKIKSCPTCSYCYEKGHDLAQLVGTISEDHFAENATESLVEENRVIKLVLKQMLSCMLARSKADNAVWNEVCKS